MISVNEAKNLIREHTKVLTPVELPLTAAAGHVVALDQIAPLDIPAFRQSSMDGYAVCFEDLSAYTALEIIGEIAAGLGAMLNLPAGKAVRIFTGAPVPEGADTVVMQEKCRVEGNQLTVTDTQISEGANLRPVGGEIRKGKLALQKGRLLTAAATGYLAGMGVAHISVYPLPVVSILVTGNELQTAGNPLQFGQVYESNSLLLNAGLQEAGIQAAKVSRIADHPDQLAEALAESLEKSDLVLICGGVSVGDYDFTLEACQRTGVDTIFHKVAQKPGKPLFFGKKSNKLVFGLPGNPASVLTCFYEYVLEAIDLLKGRRPGPGKALATLPAAYNKPAGITHFLKGSYQNGQLTVLEGQESYKLNSFAAANCLIVIPENLTRLEAGEAVEIHLIPAS